ncbi:hypothetical protein ONS96_008128 [Cadophora gregata f. sp. sojae]|nr:hypothetical protein ONS96_008128 [Cadophora gregata f. sp. sojae]
MIYHQMGEYFSSSLATTAKCCEGLITTVSLNCYCRLSGGTRLLITWHSGFDLWDSSFDDNFHAVKNARTPNQCVRTSPEEPTTTTKGSRSQNSITSADITTTIMVHEAWMLTWAASDRSTLSPNLPDLTNGTTLPTWVPGDKIPDGEYDDTSSREKKSAQRDNHLILTVGLVGGAALFLIVDGLMICCMCTTDERKKNKRETETSRIRMVRVLNARPQN